MSPHKACASEFMVQHNLRKFNFWSASTVTLTRADVANDIVILLFFRIVRMRSEAKLLRDVGITSWMRSSRAFGAYKSFNKTGKFKMSFHTQSFTVKLWNRMHEHLALRDYKVTQESILSFVCFVKSWNSF